MPEQDAPSVDISTVTRCPRCRRFESECGTECSNAKVVDAINALRDEITKLRKVIESKQES